MDPTEGPVTPPPPDEAVAWLDEDFSALTSAARGKAAVAATSYQRLTSGLVHTNRVEKDGQGHGSSFLGTPSTGFNGNEVDQLISKIEKFEVAAGEGVYRAGTRNSMSTSGMTAQSTVYGDFDAPLTRISESSAPKTVCTRMGTRTLEFTSRPPHNNHPHPHGINLITLTYADTNHTHTHIHMPVLWGV